MQSRPEPPSGAVPFPQVDRCIARAIVAMFIKDLPPAYLGRATAGGCCLGGLMFLGYGPPAEDERYFVSSGRPDHHGGAAEFLKRSPELVDQSFAAMGEVAPLPGSLVVRSCQDVDEGEEGVRSIMMLG